jgi:MFS transporter, NNP family, nitrate/nitrite transporter
MAEVRYSGTKVVTVSPDYADNTKFADEWLPARRGFATGVFGAGMGGTALSAFFTPRLVRSIGYVPTHLLIVLALVVVGAVLWLLMRDSPAWKPNLAPVVPKLAAAARLSLTWQMSFLYAVFFGGFVAFSTYLPTYLKKCLQLRFDWCRHQNRRFCYRSSDRTTDRRNCG